MQNGAKFREIPAGSFSKAIYPRNSRVGIPGGLASDANA